MIGELNGTPERTFAKARAIFKAISPLGRVCLSEDGSELVFETTWAKGVMIERYRIRAGFPKELVCHAGVLSLKRRSMKRRGEA